MSRQVEQELKEKSKETLVFSRPDSMYEMANHYCPGCGHGIIHNMLGECIDELGIKEDTIFVAPVGCAVMAFLYFKMDGCEAPHGRIPAVATGIRRVHPDKTVIAYQGDGDLLAIGMAETIHAANRGENITVIFVNNVNYGMTGGQMAPTTLIGQKTKTTPAGRSVANEGYPIRACELLNTLEAPVFIERCSIHNVANILKTKRAIKKGLGYQLDKKGYSFIEVLSTCPTNWGMTPVESLAWLEKNMIPHYPLGNLRDKGA
jgi:2-oxoglutarate ferredoxin oxidoreductase subunit beta